MIHSSQNLNILLAISVISGLFLFIAPVHAFTADSLSIKIDENGNAIATFQFTLNGVIENAIPESVLEDQLVKGLSTSSNPPQIISFDKSQATLSMHGFAVTNTLPNGTEYTTTPMDFKNAQIAFQNSAVSTVITADFTPQIMTVTFPDGYSRQFTSTSSLPSVDHIIVNPSAVSAGANDTGSIQINTSPENTQVYIDEIYVGQSPGLFSGLSSGTHQVTLEANGFLTQTSNVSVTAGQTTQLAQALSYASTPTTKSPAPEIGVILPLLTFVIYCRYRMLGK